MMARGTRASRSGAPYAAPVTELDGAVRNRQPECCPDGTVNEADRAAVSTHEFGGDGETKARSAGSGRALEGLKQVRARLFGETRPSIRNFDDNYRPFAPSREADLVTTGVIGRSGLKRLNGVAAQIEKNPEQLIRIGIQGQTAFDRRYPANGVIWS